LLLGVYDDHRLRYAGNVGTGFTEPMLVGLMRQLRPLHRDTSPFGTPVPPRYARGDGQ
jgi:bifunctional non-homologous end joining protein LigD